MTTQNKDASQLAAYKVGDTDTRPWGGYTVTGVGHTETGEEFCEKEIRVNPGQILSLQSHEHRREHWRVEKGTLTVVLDGSLLTLEAGQDVRIPLGGVHCMANLTDDVCIVFERQEGLCREEDIRRYFDAYGRGTDVALSNAEINSLTVYKTLLQKLLK